MPSRHQNNAAGRFVPAASPWSSADAQIGADGKEATMGGRFGKLLLSIGGLLLLACAVKPAAASTMTLDITFGASNFFPGRYPDLVLGRFTVTLEPGVRSEGPATLDFSQLPLDSSLAYFYGPEKDELIVGGSAGGAGGLSGNDFILHIDGFTLGSLLTSPPTFFSLEASSTGAPGVTYTSFHGSVYVAEVAVPIVAATPLPAALPLFAAALGGLGFAGWRRRKSAAA
jgi:hypothetical protein